MTKPRYDVPEASGGSRTGNLLAGLGKTAIDMFTGKRELMLNRAKKIDDKTIDVGFRAIDAELDKQRLIEFAPLMQTTGVTKITPYSIEGARKGNQPGQKPNTKGKTGNTKSQSKPAEDIKDQGKPTTEDSAPKSSTSKMKPVTAKAPAAKRASKKAAAPKTGSAPKVDQNATAKEAKPGLDIKTSKKKVQNAPTTKIPNPGAKAKNGNASSANGNKKGGM